MMKKIKKVMALLFVVVVLLCFISSGCGRKAPPKPPGKEKPSTVQRFILFY